MAPSSSVFYTLSLHDALPISFLVEPGFAGFRVGRHEDKMGQRSSPSVEILLTDCVVPVENRLRSEEHTSELQSRLHLVCRLLLEKKKFTNRPVHHHFQIHWLY